MQTPPDLLIGTESLPESACLTVTSREVARVVKCVSWSYPTSANAVRFNFPLGCFTVALTTFFRGKASTEWLAGFATESEAFDHAVSLPNDWASWAKVCVTH